MANSVLRQMREMFLMHEDKSGYLVFVRHGESKRQAAPEEDHDNYDTGLSPEGREQAEAVADRLADRTVHALYSSPLKRTYETAEIVSKRVNLDVTIEDDIREVDIDHEKALEIGWDEESFENSDDEQTSIKEFRWGAFSFAESSESFRERVRSTVNSIAEAHPGETVVLVSHAGVINAYLMEYLGLDHDFLTLPAHTSVSTLRALDHRRVIVTVNDYSHLR